MAYDCFDHHGTVASARFEESAPGGIKHRKACHIPEDTPSKSVGQLTDDTTANRAMRYQPSCSEGAR